MTSWWCATRRALGASVSFSPFGAPEAGYTLDIPLLDATTATGLTQEIRVAGDGERVDWVIGTFYSTSERQYWQSAQAQNYVAANGAAVSEFLAGRDREYRNSVWSGSRSLAGRPDTEELFFSDLNYDFNQLAVFGEVSLAVTDRFSLTGGLRWYDFNEARTQTFDGLFSDPLDSEGTTTAAAVTSAHVPPLQAHFWIGKAAPEAVTSPLFTDRNPRTGSGCRRRSRTWSG